MIENRPAKRAVSIHFDDDHVFQSSMEDFKQDATAAGLQDRLTY